MLKNEVKTVVWEKDVYDAIEQFRKDFDADGRIIISFSQAANSLVRFGLEARQAMNQAKIKKVIT